MSESLEPTDLGFTTADADQVRLQFDGGELALSFTDWQEVAVSVLFRGVLGFRWNDELDFDGIRDDIVYVMNDSVWLDTQARLSGEAPARYLHLKLCFNACGVLDVLCQASERLR